MPTVKLVSAQLYHIGEEIADDDFALPNGFSRVLETLKQQIPEKAFKFSTRNKTRISLEHHLHLVLLLYHQTDPKFY
jgi:hypothetical protein